MTTRSTAIKPHIHLYTTDTKQHLFFFTAQFSLRGVLFNGSSSRYYGGSLHYQPQNCIVIREIPQNYHRFVLFEFSPHGKFMETPVTTYYEYLPPSFRRSKISPPAFANVEWACFLFCGFESTADWLPFFDGGCTGNVSRGPVRRKL